MLSAVAASLPPLRLQPLTSKTPRPTTQPDGTRWTRATSQEKMAFEFPIPLTIATPLKWRTKAETWTLAQRLGGATLVDLIVEHSHTC